ncbi:MAG: glycosyltransferase family 2 protein [Desulfomicrobiaceae bacterium]|nr:glycosyltransferase family 2 protein [Desulfomicrobiaceae bacterium]
MPPVLSIIIPVYGQWRFTRDCLQSLHKELPAWPVEIIVVDNGSEDETAHELPGLGAALFGAAFRLVRHPANLGFARGCNSGAAHAQGAFLLFLNNDTLALPGFADPLVAALRAQGGIVGSRLLYPGAERVQHVGVAFTPGPKVCHVFEQFPASHPAVNRPRRVQAVTGAALALPRELFQRLGGFDEGYTNGLEDVDLCLRAQGLGEPIQCQPQSTLIHFTSQTPGRFAAETANALRFAARWKEHIRPDFHRHLQAEGYHMGLSPSLHPVMLLPPQREAAMAARLAHTTDPAAWLAAITEEPLWQPGYERLTHWLEARGAWQEALPLRFLAAQFFPGAKQFLALAKTATRAGDTALTRYAGKLLEEERQADQHASELIRLARHLNAVLTTQGEAALAALYDHWAEARGRNAPYCGS